jgi:5-methylcytosine-specific restriction enzyme A
MASVRTDSGRRLNRVWGVNARHALYHKDGTWYERLERFPGALFDTDGYVLFETEDAFVNCPYLRITEQVNVPGGIAHIPGYRRMRN